MSRTHTPRHRGLLAGVVPALVIVLLVPVSVSATAPTLEQKVVAGDGAAGDLFGNAVAVDGTTMVVGAPVSGGGKGALYVFERSADTWTNIAKLTASDGAADDYLGVSVAVDGDTIVAGARGDDVGGADQGSVYTFARTGPVARTETAKLTASDGAVGDVLGWSVAVEGDTIVAGAPYDDAGATRQGSVYTFARTGPAARTETAKLTASDGATLDYLGASVAVEGDTIVAGAPGDDLGGADQGSVYTFARTGPAARTETAKLTASDGATGDYLGYSVAVEGDVIVAGAPYDDVGAANQGSVYTFARTGPEVRTETGKLTASDGAIGDEFGYSVAVEGDVIVAGAPYDDVGAANQGSVYTFARTGPAVRTETGNLTASDGSAGDQLGTSAAVSGDTIAAGALYDDVGTISNQGSVSAYFAPVPVPDTTAPNTTGLKGPKTVEKGKVAKFRFSSSEPGSTFRCKVDKKRWKHCTAPYKVKTSKLKVGKHTLRVVAIDAAGNVDPSPAKRTFRVVPRESVVGGGG